MIYEIPLWPKSISSIYIHFDSVATISKSYNHVYNGKLRHLDVRRNIVCELITEKIIYIEVFRSQQNTVDQLTKGLSRDFVNKSKIRMGLKLV